MKQLSEQLSLIYSISLLYSPSFSVCPTHVLQISPAETDGYRQETRLYLML